MSNIRADVYDSPGFNIKAIPMVKLHVSLANPATNLCSFDFEFHSKDEVTTFTAGVAKMVAASCEVSSEPYPKAQPYYEAFPGTRVFHDGSRFEFHHNFPGYNAQVSLDDRIGRSLLAFLASHAIIVFEDQNHGHRPEDR